MKNNFNIMGIIIPILATFIVSYIIIFGIDQNHNGYQERCIHSWTEVDSLFEGITV